MLNNKNIFYLAITLKTKMIHKNYEIWISIEKVITCNFKNCAELPKNFFESILKIISHS